MEAAGPELFARLATRMGTPPIVTGSSGDLHLQVLRLAPGGWSHPGINYLRLTVPLAQDGRVIRRIPGEREQWVRGVKRQGTVSVTPPGAEGEWRWLDPSEFGLLFLPESMLRDAFDECGADPSRHALRPVLAAPDQVVGAVFATLLREIHQENRRSRLLTSSASLFLAQHVLATYGALPDPGDGQQLDRRRFNRLLDAIEADLAFDWSVAELAREVGLSPFRFAHAFKKATGSSPRRFVQGRRLDCARRMLIETDLPIVMVAAHCGFESQSWFTTSFGRAFGATPAAYRRQHR